MPLYGHMATLGVQFLGGIFGGGKARRLAKLEAKLNNEMRHQSNLTERVALGYRIDQQRRFNKAISEAGEDQLKQIGESYQNLKRDAVSGLAQTRIESSAVQGQVDALFASLGGRSSAQESFRRATSMAQGKQEAELMNEYEQAKYDHHRAKRDVYTNVSAQMDKDIHFPQFDVQTDIAETIGTGSGLLDGLLAMDTSLFVNLFNSRTDKPERDRYATNRGLGGSRSYGIKW